MFRFPRNWNGETWTVDQTPSVLVHYEDFASDLSFSSVSCTSATTCEAVGYSNYSQLDADQPDYTLAASWDGSSWALQQTVDVADPTDGGNDLTSVSCVTSSLCTAVGWDFNPEGGFTGPQTLAEEWNGTTWTQEAMPTFTGGTAQLNSVSCTSATECLAVGSMNGQALAESWDGSTWTVQTTPDPSGAESSSLAGISCSGTDSCDTVGSYSTSTGNFAFAESWDGTTWTLETTPAPAGAASSALSGISCDTGTGSGSGTCTAVGDFDSGTGSLTLTDSWDGTAWTVDPSPDPAVSQSTSLTGVSCIADGACQAVGSETAGGVSEPISESSTGSTWSPGDLRYPGFGTESLSGITCETAIECQAVGSFQGQNLAEGWNGSGWSLESTPIEWVHGYIQVPSTLYSVSCPSSSMCVGAGETWTYSPETGLVGPFPDVSMLNGGSWSNQVLSFDNVGRMNGVSCVSTTDCLSVGFSPQLRGAVIERWNGSAWKMQVAATPTGGSLANLKAVSCIATSCTAVGSYITSSGKTATLAETRIDKTWTVERTPLPTGAVSSTLSGVSCTSASACSAVGSYKESDGDSSALVESWDGTSWTIDTMPPLSGNSSLNGISCTSVSACTAVGANNGTAMIDTWNGSTGAIGPAPVPFGTTSSSLNGVSCFTDSSGASCAAVGTFKGPQGNGAEGQGTLAVSMSASSPFVKLQPWNQFADSGGGATFTSEANGSPVPSVGWEVSTDNGATWTPLSDGVQPDGSVISGAATGNLSIADVQADENGNKYEAVFSNSAGSTNSVPAALNLT